MSIFLFLQCSIGRSPCQHKLVDTTLNLGRRSFPFSPKSLLRITGYLPLPLLQHFQTRYCVAHLLQFHLLSTASLLPSNIRSNKMPFNWTVERERQMLLLAICEANLKPTMETWSIVAKILGEGITPSAVRWDASCRSSLHFRFRSPLPWTLPYPCPQSLRS